MGWMPKNLFPVVCDKLARGCSFWADDGSGFENRSALQRSYVIEKA
jgi:hypothetical protein